MQALNTVTTGSMIASVLILMIAMLWYAGAVLAMEERERYNKRRRG